MLRKIWSIAFKDLYITFTDRNSILIMILTPLVLASIIGLAFSSFFGTGGGDVPVQDIPVAVVNLDAGADFNDTTLNHGQIFVEALVPEGEPAPENPLHQLTDTVALDDATAARAGVDDGTYTAAIIIPPDFTERLTVSAERREIQPVAVEVYASPANPISASIIASITESFANQIALGNITIAATIDALIERAMSDPAFGIQFGAASAAGGFTPDFSAAFTPSANPIRINQQTVTGEAAGFNPLVSFGSAQAVFFMMFTAMSGANNLLEERRRGTLQRQLVSPTPRVALLLGKFAGTFITCVAQVTILLFALTLVGSLIAGEFQLIWGTNIPLIAAVIVCVSLAASGVGALLASLVKTPEQGNTIGSIISLVFGLFSGAFFTVDMIPGANVISRLTVNYWGVEAFYKLARNQTDIGLNLVVLLVLGVVFFSAGLLIFNRRLSA